MSGHNPVCAARAVQVAQTPPANVLRVRVASHPYHQSYFLEFRDTAPTREVQLPCEFEGPQSGSSFQLQLLESEVDWDFVPGRNNRKGTFSLSLKYELETTAFGKTPPSGQQDGASEEIGDFDGKTEVAEESEGGADTEVEPPKTFVLPERPYHARQARNADLQRNHRWAAEALEREERLNSSCPANERLVRLENYLRVTNYILQQTFDYVDNMPTSFGKLYTVPNNARSIAIRAVAKANNLELDIVERTEEKPFPAEYAKLNPLNKVPSFEGNDGYVLTESLAIAVYITSQNEKTTLLGKTKQDYASILRWMSLGTCELLGPIANYIWPIFGRVPYNKKNVDDSLAQALKVADVLEKHLLINTFLVGERLTLADLYVAGICSRGFQWIFDKEWRQQNPNLTRWYNTVTQQPIYSAIVSKPDFCNERLKNTPPQQAKKEKAPQPKKEAAKPKAAEAKSAEADEEDEPAPAPKPKHPIEALGKPTLALDDWKRKYSNEETREVALPWFWQELKTDEYSLWRCDYKYNDELTQVFMTSNLIGGFFARLEASRKYIFGCASVFGKSNDSVVRGAFVIRGHDAAHAFDVAPDYDSYTFTKLDPASKDDREFVDDMWAWDKPIEVDGKTYEWADGKVFK